MSYGTSDTTVNSSPNPEARNLNAIDASAAQRWLIASTQKPSVFFCGYDYEVIMRTMWIDGLLI